VSDDALAELATDELVERALVLDDEDEHDDDAYWAIVSELQRRGGRETFEAARALCLDDADDARCLGVAVLSQLGYPEGRPFLEESLPLVIALFEHGASEDVLAAALHALGHLQDPRGAAAVLSKRSHPDATVRLAVAQAAEGVAGEPPDETVVDAVVELTRDEDDAVRNWAIFSLALLFEADDPVIRETLHARIEDGDPATSAEALAGLAVRKDPRAAPALLARLQAASEPPVPEPYVVDVLVDAAEQLADPRFIPALAMLREQTAHPDAHARLTDAIATCAATSRRFHRSGHTT
jgi:HEAT repeat protein